MIPQSIVKERPWSTFDAPPCAKIAYGLNLSAPTTSEFYKTPRHNPWRPTLGYEEVEITPVVNQPITNQLVDPCTTPAGMTTDPLRFPNLVTGFDRNPQHAAKAALYLRYTSDEWQNSATTIYKEADSNRKYSEQLRHDIVRSLRETDEQTTSGQVDSGFRIGERIIDVNFWKKELSIELDKLVAETKLLADSKRNAAKALQDLEGALHIAQECLYHREYRSGNDKVHDVVEKNLLIEIDNLRSSQTTLREVYTKISNQLSDNRNAQFLVEEDVVSKDSAIGVDTVCHKLTNFSRGLNYYGGVENYDKSISTGETWSAESQQRVLRSQGAREKSMHCRNETEKCINGVATSVWNTWNHTNDAFQSRIFEMGDAKNKLQIHLQKIIQEIFAIERHIALLRKAIQDKSDPLKVARSRLEARNHRVGIELCRDSAQLRLVKEVNDLQDCIATLHDKLLNGEEEYQQLIKTRTNLETELKNKADALFIDREKCMSLRRSFPINKLIKYD